MNGIIASGFFSTVRLLRRRRLMVPSPSAMKTAERRGHFGKDGSRKPRKDLYGQLATSDAPPPGPKAAQGFVLLDVMGAVPYLLRERGSAAGFIVGFCRKVANAMSQTRATGSSFGERAKTSRSSREPIPTTKYPDNAGAQDSRERRKLALEAAAREVNTISTTASRPPTRSACASRRRRPPTGGAPLTACRAARRRRAGS